MQNPGSLTRDSLTKHPEPSFNAEPNRIAQVALATNIPPSCPAGDPIYTYDILDRVTSMTNPVGTTTYHYDSLSGRLDTITTPQGKKFAYTCNNGQLQSLMYPNGISAYYSFDNNGNLEDLHYQRSDMSTVQRFRYAYDTNNMRKSMTDNDGVHDYTYDSLYQIIEATHPTVANPLEQFAYDAVGNRLGMGRVHNELNQLTEDDSCWYSYDLDGNMTEKVSKSTNDTMYFVWDIENKLTEVRKPGMVAQYTYDALGRRMSKTVNGVKTQFRYDGDDLILEMDSNDSITASYTFGPSIDNLLMMHRANVNYYYVKDGLGSVTALTDSFANVVKEYQYSVFGEIVKETGVEVLNPFKYTAREWDGEVGLYYYRARFYDASIGRFISEDPIGFSASDYNFYRYVWNAPVAFIDPTGLAAMSLADIQKLVEMFNKSGQSNELIICVMWKESGFDPEAKANGSTATGLMQMTKGAAKDAGYEYGDRTDPAVNTEAGTTYLAKRISWAKGDVKKGLEGYGTGPGYADNILECEKCMKKATSEECGDPQVCLNAIHK